jgi:hypothetical protein
MQWQRTGTFELLTPAVSLMCACVCVCVQRPQIVIDQSVNDIEQTASMQLQLLESAYRLLSCGGECLYLSRKCL